MKCPIMYTWFPSLLKSHNISDWRTSCHARPQLCRSHWMNPHVFCFLGICIRSFNNGCLNKKNEYRRFVEQSSFAFKTVRHLRHQMNHCDDIILILTPPPHWQVANPPNTYAITGREIVVGSVSPFSTFGFSSESISWHEKICRINQISKKLCCNGVKSRKSHQHPLTSTQSRTSKQQLWEPDTRNI